MNKSLLKNVGVVVGGVMIAGYIMYQFRDIAMIDQARNGYGG